MEEDLSDDFDVISDDDLAIPGVPTPGQEDDLVAATDAILERVKAKYDDFREEQEEKNEQFFQNSMETQAETMFSRVEQVNQFANSISELQLATLERQLRRKEITEEQYDKRKKEIMKKQARRQKAMDVFENVIGTIRAVTQALPNIPLSILVGAIGAANTAAIIARPLPKFATGVVAVGEQIGLQGAGTETSDSIPALLSRGETVTSAKQTRKHRPALEAIHRDRFDQYITEAVTKEQAKAAKVSEDDAAILQAFSSGFSDIGIRHDLKSIKNQSKINARMLVDALSKSMKEHPRNP